MALANLQTVILWSAVAFAVYCALLLLARSARLIGRRRRPKQRWQDRLRTLPERHAAEPVFLDPATMVAPSRVREHRARPATDDMLRLVRGADFSRRRVIDADADRVFRIVEREISARWPAFRTLPRTALSEIIETPDRTAQQAIVGNRVDVLVTDADGLALLAIEIQSRSHRPAGTGPGQSAGREALRTAGVAWMELQDYHTQGDITRMVQAALSEATQPSPHDTLADHRQSA